MAHRYWRVRITRAHVTTITAAEVEFRETPGGADVTGSGTASSSALSSGTAAGAFANDGATTSANWAASTTINGMDAWLAYDFGGGNEKDIVEFAWTIGATASRNPRDCLLEFSDDAVFWSPHGNPFVEIAAAAASATTVYTASGTDAETIPKMGAFVVGALWPFDSTTVWKTGYQIVLETEGAVVAKNGYFAVIGPTDGLKVADFAGYVAFERLPAIQVAEINGYVVFRPIPTPPRKTIVIIGPGTGFGGSGVDNPLVGHIVQDQDFSAMLRLPQNMEGVVEQDSNFVADLFVDNEVEDIFLIGVLEQTGDLEGTVYIPHFLGAEISQESVFDADLTVEDIVVDHFLEGAITQTQDTEGYMTFQIAMLGAIEQTQVMEGGLDIGGTAQLLEGAIEQTQTTFAELSALPTHFSALQHWFDAADAGTITASSGLVSTWSDKSGAGRHATASGGARPLTGAASAGGNNLIKFDGTDLMTLAWDTTTDEWSTTIAFRSSTQSTNANWYASPMIFGREVGGVVNDMGIYQYNGYLAMMVRNTGIAAGTFNQLMDGEMHVVTFTRNTTGAVTMTVDGVTDNTTTIDGSTINAAAFIDIGFNGWIGDLGELCTHKTVLTNSQIKLLHAYMLDKWAPVQALSGAATQISHVDAAIKPEFSLASEFNDATEYQTNWADLGSAWTVNGVITSANRIYGTSGDPGGAFYPFTVAADEKAKYQTVITRVTGQNPVVMIGLAFGGTNPVAGSPSTFLAGMFGYAAAYVGANFTGTPEGVIALNGTGSLANGDYYVTVSIDETTISCEVRNASTDLSYTYAIPRSTAPNGGVVTGLMIWNQDTRGSSGGHYIGPAGVKKSLTPNRIKSVGGVNFENANSGWSINHRVGAENYLVQVPPGHNVAEPYPLVIFFHGAGSDERDLWHWGGGAAGVAAALSDAGYVVASLRNTPDSWGNQAAVDSIQDMIDWINGNVIQTNDVFYYGASMGAATAFNAVIHHATLRSNVKAMAVLSGVASLQNMYDSSLSFISGLHTAYGATNFAEFGYESALYDPVLSDLSTFSGLPVKFWVPTADSVVDIAANSTAMKALLDTAGASTSVVVNGSSHLPLTQFDGAALVTFFDTYKTVPETVPHAETFTSAVQITDFERRATALDFLNETFTTDSGQFTYATEGTLGTPFAFTGGQGVLVHSASRNSIAFDGNDIQIPQVWVQMDMISRSASPASGYDVIGVGVGLDADNFIVGVVDRTNNVLRAQVKIGGSNTNYINLGYTATTPGQIGVGIVNNTISIWTTDSIGGAWTLRGTADFSAQVDFRDTDLTGWQSCIFLATGSAQTWTLDNFIGSRFGSVGMRDMTLISNEDGSPVDFSGKFRFTASLAHTTASSYCGVVEYDPVTEAVQIVGIHYVNRDGKLFNDHASHLVKNADTTFRYLTSTWGNGFGNVVQILHKDNVGDITSGVNILSGMTQLSLPLIPGTGDGGAYDPYLIKHAGEWVLAYAVVDDTTFAGEHFYLAAASSPDMASFTGIGSDPSREQVEGPKIVVANGAPYIHGGGRGEHPTYDIGMNYLGEPTFSPALYNGVDTQPHIQIVPYNTNWLAITWNQVRFNSVAFTWGDFLVYEAPRE